MAKTADKTDPKLWEKVKTDVTKGDKGGKPGQWSARKAQLAVNEYKHEGGGYKGKKFGRQPPGAVGTRRLGHQVRPGERQDGRALLAQKGTRGAHTRGLSAHNRQEAGG